jgi:hypothetical protein
MPDRQADWRPVREDEILTRAIEHFGQNCQARKTQEELAELIVAISHDLKNNASTPVEAKERWEHVVEEIADVEIMLEQLKIAYDCKERVKVVKQAKLSRLVERMRGDSNE